MSPLRSFLMKKSSSGSPLGNPGQNTLYFRSGELSSSVRFGAALNAKFACQDVVLRVADAFVTLFCCQFLGYLY